MESPKKRILVIDDEVHIRRVIQLMLSSRDYDVITAVDGQEGIRLIETDHPDVVISDLNMPKVNGRTLCERTNGMKEEKPFLTIVMTSQISSGDDAWLSRLNETVFMEKPFSPIKLADYIDGYFSGKR